MIGILIGLWAGQAAAAGYSMDIELVRPYWSPTALPGVGSPEVLGPGAWRVGTMLQFERAPLILYRAGDDVGAVIGGRTTLDLGVEVDASRWLALHASIPISNQGNSDIYTLAADGLGAGDMVLGGRARIGAVGPVLFGVQADLMLPTSTPESWRGESDPRGLIGGTMAFNWWRLGVLADLGTMLRKTQETDEDLLLGPEIVTDVALSYALYRDDVLLWTGVTGRMGALALLQGGAENNAELMSGLRFQSNPKVRVDLFLGTGLTEGYGTTDYRMGAQVMYLHPPRAPEPEVVVDVRPPPPDITEVPEPEIEPEPVVVQWKPQELARIEQDQIIIRDPIQFEFGKDVILPVSLPTLEQVAQIMAEHPEILHIVIEGHASEEGSFYYNYDLSLRRANAIWRELVVRGVHPSRMSTRSMGEVDPKNLGTDETSLAENRRVVFTIIDRWQPGDPEPVYSKEVKRPWDGEKAAIKPLPPLPKPEPKPEPKPPPKPGEEEKIDPDQFREQDEPEEQPEEKKPEEKK